MERHSPSRAPHKERAGWRPGVARPAGRTPGAGIAFDENAPVQYVKGVGPRRAECLAKLGIQTVGQLIWHLPRRHEDRRHFKPIASVVHGAVETVCGKVVGAASERRRGLTITRVLLADESGLAQLIWFNQPYMQRRFPKGMHLVAHGKVERRFGAIQISNPECEAITGGDMVSMGRIVPIYPLTEGLTQAAVRNAIFGLLPVVRALPETLPEALCQRYNLVARGTALADLHFPPSWEAHDAALRRLVFEEFFCLQVRLAVRKGAAQTQTGIAFRVDGAIMAEIAAMWPFPLTQAQQRVLAEIQADMQAPHPMHRLLQGDVGSGKTAVAAAAALVAIRNGYQVGLMAPTEILAEQHFLTLRHLFAARGITVDLLTGSLSERERQAAYERLKSGQTALAIGTHALIQEAVLFRRLGLVIIDEQHRFGVMQRQALWEKGFQGALVPDLLVMTATPIPRTLALTLYGDLDLSVIDELPPGRQPVITQWFSTEERDVVLEFLRDQVRQGRQAYYVCALIEESDALYAQSAVEKAAELRQVFPRFRIGLLHGRMRPSDRAETMEAFRAGEMDILVCTTVIEVGVDVPNATVMVIEDADRFGLAQLHQLRGRVGRGCHQSYCLLITSPQHHPFAAEGQGTSDGQRRMRVMVETTDGFRIAEEDLKIRGPGEAYGTRQHGFEALGSLRVANILRDAHILEEARDAAFALIAEDPHLERPEHAPLRQALCQPMPSEFAVVG